MAKRELPTPEELRNLLRYEPETGKLYWLERPLEMFSDEWLGKSWNTRFAGREALTADNGHGYPFGTVNYNRLKAHRVIWAMVHGEWPKGEIDHINGQRDDNRLVNLRCVTRAENARNRARMKRNTSGRTGVYWQGRCGKWVASINGTYLGIFERFEDAVAARERAEIEHGYHPNHDRIR
jgi:hypothetical protein